MKNLLIVTILVGTLMSCNFVDNAKQSAVESLIEKTTGLKVEASDLQNLDKSKAIVKLRLDGDNLEQRYNGAVGHINGTKEIISIAVTKSDGDSQLNIMIGFTAADLTRMRPIKGEMNNPDGTAANFSFTISSISDNNIENMISHEAEGEIITLTDEKAVLRIKAKVSDAYHAEDPMQWKTVEGTVEIEYPIFSTLGIKKEDLTYR